ncbi:oocyte zinc finger protein XlCOF6-like [Hyla sarda]|uniref:oocyte zinc finger protein XlCOF6-like n=1 Tax=Hyla sarda TaxID=327740 RepID=UPI0024C2C744|nr:oocyte zinc finger protein XlCOF6-like [Hyla sarda]XP_056377045.1 oocyte zinc finger protein XlCOF6-like [Hyla sarda]XP_056377046.1 oocyte zinc finger protein XlCOF6-like [Hyla sarda]
MNELKYKFESITPTALHIHAEITTASFYACTAEDLDARMANLVEVFLLEVYRCKLCQFTSSLKNKICHHVSDVHQLDQTPLIPGSTEHEESDSYGIGEDMAQDNKENEENLEKIPFLYRMLNTLSPGSCDMSLGDQSGNNNMVGASEVNSLFEGEQSEFPLDESMPSDSMPPSSSVNSPKSKDEDDAQCEHLLSLGLYRISNLRPLSLPTEAKVPKSNLVEESARSRCRKLANPPSLSADHIKNNADKKQSYKCSSCQLEFETKDTYKVHVQCHKHGGGFTCLYCDCFMSEWDPMEKHIKSHRLVRKSYQCQVCEKRFMTQSAWKSHMRGHDQKSDVFLCTKCPLSFDSESVRNLHVTCHSEDVFKCCQCGLVEQEWNKIYEHLCTHDSSLKPFTCSTCSKRFFTKSQMKAHSSKHKKHKVLACSSCSLTFKNSHQMNKHQRHDHLKQSNKDCKESAKEKVEDQSRVDVPKGSFNLQRIEKREFICEICNRKCSSKLALQRHMGVHAGDKPFHCSHCEYKTRLKASLTQHMRVHTGEKPFKCQLCSYASIDASSLRRHMRTHTSEKPYKCQRCSYSCIQKKSLDLHIRRHHTGEVFKCSLCQYSTPDKQLLHKHTKKHHTNEDPQQSSEEPTS